MNYPYVIGMLIVLSSQQLNLRKLVFTKEKRIEELV